MKQYDMRFELIQNVSQKNSVAKEIKNVLLLLLLKIT